MLGARNIKMKNHCSFTHGAHHPDCKYLAKLWVLIKYMLIKLPGALFLQMIGPTQGEEKIHSAVSEGEGRHKRLVERYAFSMRLSQQQLERRTLFLSLSYSIKGKDTVFPIFRGNLPFVQLGKFRGEV